MNAQGHDIYIRPAGSVGLILVDDLNPEGLVQLTRDGFTPAVVVETSARNYQAWLRLSEPPIAPEQATMSAQLLAERYGGDPASGDWRHFGRLADFTNRKPKHQQERGIQPFVLVRDAAGATTERGAQILEEAMARLQAAREAARAVPVISAPTEGLPAPGAAYAAAAERIIARYQHADLSRLDWMVCCDLASGSLAVDAGYLEQALREGSPGLAQRKAGHIDDYVTRTARKVMRDPDVVAARQRLNGHSQRHL